jgi:hypothetical protein
LLLVMDRRAKIVARNKAIAAHAEQVAARNAARARARELNSQDEEARRVEWERKRQELHDLLRDQEKELADERMRLDGKLATLGHYMQQEKQALAALEKRLLDERSRLDVKSQLLAQMRQGIARSEKSGAAAQAEVEKLARDLAQLERALQDMKALKNQERETYSLVPYRGKLGEGRRPVYVECAADGLVFHPGQRRLDQANFDVQSFRSEVQRRGVDLVREKYDPERPNRPPLPKVSTNPYVLFLVRPDGLESYYNATAALRGFDLDFGYELIDAHWVLDFSDGSGFGGTTAGARPLPPPLSPQVPRKDVAVRGFPFGPGGPGSGPPDGAGTPVGTGSTQPGLGPAQSGSKPSLGYPQPANQAVENPRTGNATGIGLSVPINSPGNPGSAYSASLNGPANGPRGADSPGGGLPFNGNDQPGAQPLRPGDGYAGQGYGSGQPGSELMSTPRGNAGNPAGGPPGPAQSAKAQSGQGQGGQAQPGQGQPGQGQPLDGQGNPQDVSWRGSPSSARLSQGGTTGQPAAGGTRSAGGSPNGNDAGDSGAGDPLARFAPNVPFSDLRPGPKKPAPAPSVGRLLANRDFIITVECFSDVVALYPSSKVFAAAANANQAAIDEALVQAVLQLIARRQATVRGGEMPYRPLLRFQVHPEALRTYYHVYPLFENLRIPMARENLDS